MTAGSGQPKGPAAVDRKELAKDPPSASGEWPRTDRRVARLQSALRHRQRDLAVVLENVHDIHNISAVIRSCDAVGIPILHLIYTIEDPPRGRFARRVSAGTAKWVDTVQWTSVDECFEALHGQGMSIVATAFSERGGSIYETDLTQPTAIVFGNEMRGLSDQAKTNADGEIFIPMVGMVQSLNISVSCAVTLYEVFRQRSQAGNYDDPTMSESEMSAKLAEWLKR